MVRKARIRLTSTDYTKLEEVCEELRSIARKPESNQRPVPLPTKRLRVPVLKAPSAKVPHMGQVGNAHSQASDEIDSEERVMRRIMRIRVPEEVHVTIELV